MIDGQLLESLAARRKRFIGWTIVYVLGIAAVMFLTLKAGDRLRTYTLPTGGVKLTVSKQHYKPGETVKFTIQNNYNGAVFINNSCPEEPLTVYKWVNSRWARIHQKIDEAKCAGQPRRIEVPALSQRSGNYADWGTLFKDPGLYRIVAVVNSYGTLPFADFEVMKPQPQATSNASTGATGSSTSGSQNRITTSRSSNDDGGGDQQERHSSTTYTVHVNSSGNYDDTNLSLKVGDSIKLIYSAPYHDEVRTRFSPGTVSSLTLDEEFTSGVRIFNTKGTWTFKADDHNGNTGTIIVN